MNTKPVSITYLGCLRLPWSKYLMSEYIRLSRPFDGLSLLIELSELNEA